MDEYIEREALTLFAYKSGDYGHPAVVDLEDIAAIPAADVVEIVRCKDCKHRIPMIGMCEQFDAEVGVNHYCSLGERRSE